MSLKGEIMDINNLWSGYDLNSKKQNTRCLAVNTILEGKYLVGPVLGQGGFGITYVGYDLNMEAKIAIKEYFPVELVSRDTTTMHGDRVLSLSGEKSVTYKAGLKKYVAEAQNVSQFSEIPGIVSVKDFFYANETAYIVMEFIDGISLKDYLKEKGGRLSEEETLKIMKPVLEALVQVHKSGIIHRDISPDNIMLTFKDGDAHNQIESVKLIDFGAARMSEKNDQKSLTIILKHGYAPEEQYRTHGEQGPWTDVYALCAVLYLMLTGETPVPAMDRMFKDDLKTFDKFNTKISVNTTTVILKGLAVKKDDRIQSVSELIGALYEGAKVKTAKPAASSGNKLKLLAGLGAAILAIGAVAIVLKGKDKTAEAIIPDAQVGEMTGNGQTIEENFETLAIEEKEDELIGEIIVSSTPQKSIAAGREHIIVRKDDGMVEAFGRNEYGQLDVEEWTHIAAVEAGDGFTAGLREDGVVLIAGKLDAADEVETWEGIVELAADGRILIGLKEDGTLVSSGLYGTTGDYYEWTDIRSVACSNWAMAALTEDGTVHLSARGDGSTGAKELAEISGWTDVEQLVCAQYAVFGLTADGDVRYASMFTDAKEGSNIDFTNMDSFRDIVQLYSDAGLTQIGVRKDGSLCVGGSVHETNWPMEVFEWDDLVGFMGLSDKYIGVKKDGTIIKAIKNYGNSTPEAMTNMEWANISVNNALIGVTKDGKALTYGTDVDLMPGASDIEKQSHLQKVVSLRGELDFIYLNEDGNTYNSEPAMTSFQWSNVKQIEGETEGGYCIGLMEDGTVKVQFSREIPDEYHANVKAAEAWKGVKQIATSGISNRNETYGLLEDGTVIYVPGYGGESDIFYAWKNEKIRSIFSGSDCIGAIKEDGTVIFSNDSENEYGQKNVASWTKITQMALGNYHTVGLREDGTVVATGNNQSGQCNVEDWTNIVYVAVGDSCTLGISSDGVLKTAGNVGW